MKAAQREIERQRPLLDGLYENAARAWKYTLRRKCSSDLNH